MIQLNEIVIPQNALKIEEMEMISGKLFKCGYAVQRDSKKIGGKTVRVIKFWKDGESNA